MATIRELVDFVVPSRCGICENSGPDLCSNCLAFLNPNPRTFSKKGVTGFAALNYDENIASLITNFKEKRQLALAKPIAETIAKLFSLIQFSENYLLVPIPSRPENFRTRGFQPGLAIAKRLSVVSGNRVGDVLRFQRSVRDQAGLSSRERNENLASSMVASAFAKDKECILIDDVVTTGSTLAEATRALSDAKAKVVTSFSLSVT